MPGARLYKTGDLVRYLSDGALEFLGRVDHQVKVRGFRIELGEIEAVLLQDPAVGAAVVLVREDSPGEQRLVAYVVPKSTQRPRPDDLRRLARAQLPAYMVPAVFVQLEALPLTPNGKLDRRALPAPVQREGEAARVLPHTPTEEVVASLWAAVLGVEEIGRTDNFFDLGGHSLLATQLMSRLRAAFAVEMPVRSVFEAPTVATLSAAIDAARHGPERLLAPALVPLDRDNDLPLSFAQQRLWFLDQLQAGGAAYNIATALRLTGSLNLAALAMGWAALVHRHEALRTTFPTVHGAAVQMIADSQAVPLPLIDLQALAAAEQIAAVQHLAEAEAQRPFALAQGPLLRLTLVRLGKAEHVLLVTLHHIVADGWSMGIMIREVAALYEACVCGRPSPLPPLPVQYADFAQWQRTWLQGKVLDAHLTYWQEQLAGAPAVLELPTDRPRPPVQTFAGGVELFRLSAELTHALTTLSRQAGVTLFMALLGAFATLLCRYSGQEDLVIGSPIANRTHRETEGLIGFFVNTLVLRLDLGGHPSFTDVLERVRQG
jgi:acyl carrier protein